MSPRHVIVSFVFNDVNDIFSPPQIDFYSNRFVGTELENPDFSAIARSMGAEGVRAERADQIAPGLDAILRSGRPGVLEILVTGELCDPFRRDALRKPKRTMAKYKDYE